MKIYNRTYSTLAQTAGVKGAAADLVIPSGESYWIAIPFPYEGVMERVICQQIGGTPVAYTLDFYKSDLGLTPGADSHSLPAWAPLMEIVDQLSATAGNVIRGSTTDVDATFRNADGDQTNPQRFIYAHLAPTAAGDQTTWELHVECRSDIG